MISDSRAHRLLLTAAWAIPTLTLIVAYTAIALYTGNAWPWLEVVHESGDRTLIGTALYYEHAARELPLDVFLGMAVAASVLLVFPRPAQSQCSPQRARSNQRKLTVATVVVIGAIVGGTLWTGGTEMLLNNLLQMHTRPGEPLQWGAHWRYHLLSRFSLMLFSVGFAGLLLLVLKGRTGGADAKALSLFGLTLALFSVISIIFAPDLAPFRDPVFLGHQVREVATHLPVTIPAAWWLCLRLAGTEASFATKKAGSVRWPLLMGLVGAATGLYLLISALGASAASQGQTDSWILLLFPHFFEHMFSYFLVPCIAGLTYVTVLRVRTR